MTSGLPYSVKTRWFEWGHPRDVFLKQVIHHLRSLPNADAIAVLYSVHYGEETQSELVQLSDGRLLSAYHPGSGAPKPIDLAPAPHAFKLVDELGQLHLEHPGRRVILPWDYERNRGMVLFVAASTTSKWIAGQIRRDNAPSHTALDRLIDALLVLQQRPENAIPLSGTTARNGTQPAAVLRVAGYAPDFEGSDSYIVKTEPLASLPRDGTKFIDDQDGGIWIAGKWNFGSADRPSIWFSPLRKGQRLAIGMIFTEIDE